jgi:2-dehydropantoate 2-reductase
LKVCIFGAGAIGGHIAGHLARAGECEVSLVARGRTRDALRAHGLTVVTPQRTFTVRPTVTDRARDLGPQDVVFVTLKTQQFEDALDDITSLLHETTAVLPPTTAIPYWFFHGVAGPHRDRRLPALDPEGRQWRAIDPSRVIGCVYWIGAHIAEPGTVVQDGPGAGCPIGEPSGASSERVRALSRLLCNSGIDAKVRGDIREAIWLRAVNSLCWNAVAVLTRETVAALGASHGTMRLIRAMMEEADAVGSALGLQVPVSIDKRIAVTLRAGEHKMSMLQDVERGRALEWDPLARSFGALRDLTSVPTPLIDTVTTLMSARADAHARQVRADVAGGTIR